MLAVAYGHSDAVSLLLEKEANVDVADIKGCTAYTEGYTSSLALVKQFVVNLFLLLFFFFTCL